MKFMKKLRFGFLSAANIGRKNWKAIFNSGNCVVTAVASRDLERSRQFIAECQRETPFENPPAPLGSYEELIASKNVDAIYFPLPTGLRKEWVLRAAAAGKHVICEKPCAVSAADLEEMISACRKNRVQFMDGVMFMHNPRLARVREVLDDGKSVGPIRRISSAFSFYPGEDFFRDNIRVDGRLEPTGCLGDLGWYCIRFALWTMNWQLPRTVTGRILSQSAAFRQTCRRRRNFPANCFLTAAFPRVFTVRFLPPSNNGCPSAARKAGCDCPILSIRSTATNPPLNSTSRKCVSPMPAAKGSARRGPDGGQPSDGAGHPDVPQLRQPGFLRQTQRRLADVGAENAAGDGCVFRVGAKRFGVPPSGGKLPANLRPPRRRNSKLKN